MSPRFGITTAGGVGIHVTMDHPPTEDERRAFSALADAAAARMKLINTCHLRVACPKCKQPVGKRCVKLSSRTMRSADPRLGTLQPLECKHPHDERWQQEVPKR